MLRERAQSAEQQIARFSLLLGAHVSLSGISYLNVAHYGSCVNRTRNHIKGIMSDFGSSEEKGNRICRIGMSLTDTL